MQIKKSLGTDGDCHSDATLYLSLHTDSIEESLVYSGATLMANLGGTLGLVFGFSLLGGLQMVEGAAAAIIRRLRQTRTRPLPPRPATDDGTHIEHIKPRERQQRGGRLGKPPVRRQLGGREQRKVGR